MSKERYCEACRALVTFRRWTCRRCGLLLCIQCREAECPNHDGRSVAMRIVDAIRKKITSAPEGPEEA